MDWTAEQISKCDWFISKYGHDTAAEWNTALGTTEVDGSNLGNSVYPFRTLAATTTNINVPEYAKIAIGGGVWTSDIKRTTYKRLSLYGGANTIFDNRDSTYFYAPLVNVTIATPDKYYNIKIINGDFHGFVGGGTLTGYFYTVYFINCVIDYVRIGGDYWITTPICGPSFEKCFIMEIYINNTIGWRRAAHIDGCTVIRYKNPHNKNASLYAKDSIIVDIDSNIGILFNAYNCFVNNPKDGWNEINLNPKFNNPEIGDYTLAADSPCLYAGSQNRTIGCYGLAFPFNANSREFTEQCGAIYSKNASNENQIIVASAFFKGIKQYLFILREGETAGNVESCWVDFQELQYLLVPHIFQNFITDESGTFTSIASQDLSTVISFQIKYCTDESEKDAAVWKNVTWNRTLSVDSGGLGNADPSFDANSELKIVARYIKIKLFMTKA